MSLQDVIQYIYISNNTDSSVVSLLYTFMTTKNFDKYDYGESPLSYTFGRRNVRQIVVRVLLEAGACVDTTNVFGRPLLVISRDAKYTKMLVEAHDCNQICMSQLFPPDRLVNVFLVQHTFVLDVLIEAF